MENQLVVFNLTNEDYGVDIGAVDGIVKMQTITKVPHAPSFVEGITNLRGEVLPVIDLRKRFGLPVGETTKDTRIVNVEVDGVKVGMVVDAVTEVLRVTEDDVEPPSPLVTTVDSDRGSRNAFITGIAKVDSRLIILLDLSKVLSTEEQTDLKALQRPGGAASSD
jgi:purine-binding chemotaxis protein CheW